MPKIIEDTRQQAGKHNAKHAWWAAHGVDVERQKLDTGDYMTEGGSVTVDTKKDVQELAGDLTRDHDRFAREAERARAAGLSLVILVEEGRYTSIGDLVRWTPHACLACTLRRAHICNPRGAGRCHKHPRHPLRGKQLAAMASTFCEHHGCTILFCRKADTARRICELLDIEYTEGGKSTDGTTDVHGGGVRTDAQGGPGAR